MALQIEQRIQRRVGAGARRIQLHRDAGVDDLPTRAEIGGQRFERRLLAVHRGEKTLRPIDCRGARRHACLCEHGRDDAVSRRHPRVQRLHHRAEILLEAGRRRRRDRQRVIGGRRIETEQPRRSGGSADGAQRRRAVPSALIVARIHRAAQPPFQLEADDVGVEQRAAGRVGNLGRRQHRRHQRRARMGQRHETHVVVVERVRRRPVGQRGVARRRPKRGPEHMAGSAGLPLHHLLHDPRGRFGGAGQRHANGVEQRARRCGPRGGRRRPGGDKATQVHSAAPVTEDSGLPSADMKRCLMNTQSSGGLAVGADSFTLATMNSGPTRGTAPARRSSSSERTVAVAAIPIARAAASRSAPCAVGVG